MSLLGMVVSVVLVLGAAYWFTRYVVGRGSGVLGPLTGSGAIRLHGQLSLGKDQKLVLAQVGERWFLLGVTAAGISMLAEFTAEEAASWQREPETPGTGPNFREAVRQVMEQKRRR